MATHATSTAALSVGSFSLEKEIDFKGLKTQISEPINPDRVRVFRITDTTPDRHGDVILASGVDLTTYIRQPRFMQFHDRESWPIGKCVAIEKRENEIIAAAEFAEETRSPNDGSVLDARGEIALQAVDRGDVNTVSVGVIPNRWLYRGSGNLSEAEEALFEIHNAEVIIAECDLF